jgi:hypothetical protein
MRMSRAAKIEPAGTGREMLLHGVARQRLDLGIAGVVGQRFDLLGVKAFGDQLRLGLGDDFMEAIIAVADAARAAFDAELFRRHAKHLCLRELARGDEGDVMDDRRCKRRRSGAASKEEAKFISSLPPKFQANTSNARYAPRSSSRRLIPSRLVRAARTGRR